MNRVHKLKQKLESTDLDGFFVSSPENRRYLSGFTGTSGFLFITKENAYLLTDFRYINQAAQQAPDFEIINTSHEPFKELNRLGKNINKLGFEGNTLPFADYERLSNNLSGIELVSAPELIESMRAIKDNDEIKLIRKAVQIADEAFTDIVKFIKEGKTEEQISLELEFLMRRKGASGRSFDFIVASGIRSSLPHGVATSKEVKNGEYITLDFGAIYQGYCSDITRTVFLGEPEKIQLEIYDIVLKAQKLGIESVVPGRTGKEIDEQVRTFIKDAGYGEFFGHGLGHSVGLAIHEGPNLNTKDERVLEPGMVVTVEPGIYIPSWGGVRIEDIVLVTDNGCEILTKAPKDLIII